MFKSLQEKTCLRVHEIGRTVWILIGTTIRLAESIGLHRDGALLKLSPFETEIRLRLWWHLCLLDSRSPEDHGFEYTVDILSRDLRLPLDVNDSQLYPEMTELPVESDSWTEMSFPLTQIEAARMLHPVLATANQRPDSPYNDIQAKRRLVHDTIQRTQRRYFSKCDMSIPLQRAAFHHFFSTCDKLHFMLQLRTELYLPEPGQAPDMSIRPHAVASTESTPNPNLNPKSSTMTTPWPAKASFKLAYNTLKRSCFLLTSECSSYMKWIFRAYTQWYAVAYVLRCLVAHPQFPAAMATWDLVDRTFNSINQLTETPLHGSQRLESNSVWSWLKTLREQALQKRQEQVSGPPRQTTTASVSASATASTSTSTTAVGDSLEDGTGSSSHSAMDMWLQQPQQPRARFQLQTSTTLQDLGQNGQPDDETESCDEDDDEGPELNAIPGSTETEEPLDMLFDGQAFLQDWSTVVPRDMDNMDNMDQEEG